MIRVCHRPLFSVIDDLRRIADLPVWLIGTSRGTESVACFAIHSESRPAGIVLTSSMTEPNGGGIALTEMALDHIRVPTLILHHARDGCDNTRPEGAAVIREGLAAAPIVELAIVEGGSEAGGAVPRDEPSRLPRHRGRGDRPHRGLHRRRRPDPGGE